MALFINKILGSVVEIVLFALVPFIWWIITARKETSFFQWIGLRRIPKEHKAGAVKAVITISGAFIFLSVFILFMLKGTQTATSEFYGLGMRAFPAALVYAVFNTAFPEELLFRGFLLKRVKKKLGFSAANLV